MTKNTLRNDLRVGVIFGIVLIFLVLIGFTLTAANLLGGFLGTSNNVVFNSLLFFTLIGLWTGAAAAKHEHDWRRGGIHGTVSGAITGLLVAALAFVIGSLYEAGVQLGTYLSQLVPSTINAFLLGGSASQAALTYGVLLSLTGALGGAGSYFLRQEGWRQHLSAIWQRQALRLRTQPWIQKTALNAKMRLVLLALLCGGFLLLPLGLGQYWNYTLGTVGIYVLLGLGLNIVVGLAGLLDLGYVAFFAIGAYTVALMTAPEPHHLEWSFWAALPFAVVLAALAGITLGIPVLRMRGDYLAIVTLGFGEIIRVLSKSDLLTGFSGGPKGVRSVGGPEIFGFSLNNDIGFVYLILLAILLVIFVTNRLQHSNVGRAWVAMREDETVARAMGIDVVRYKLLAFAIGAAFAGLGGALFASRNQFTGPEDHSLMVSINVVALIIVGGMGSIPGVIAGAFVLKGLPEMLRQLESYRILTFGALLVVMMLIRPEGLIPSRRRRLEMHEDQATNPPVPNEEKP
ncbi:MAG: ABC transporter permease subunit [Chloroflexota bacterium]